MNLTARAYAEAETGVLIHIPPGSVIGHRRKVGEDGKPTLEHENIVTPAGVLLEVRIDVNRLEDLAKRAARSKGRTARQGPITLKVVRGSVK